MKWRMQEKALFNELQRICPKSFVDFNTILDCLVEMQHYDLPTRMLDLSTNCLVALLFACDIDNVAKEDGEVLLFTRHSRQVCFGNSDKVTLLTSVSQMKYEEQILLYKVATLFANILTRITRFTKDEFEKSIYEITEYKTIESKDDKASILTDIIDTQSLPLHLRTEYELKRLETLLTQTDEIVKWSPTDKDEILKEFNKLEITKRLVRQAQSEKHYFENRIIPNDLLGCLFVKPALLNQRIVKQSGAFMICGLMSDNNGEINRSLNANRFRTKTMPVIIIPSINKKKLLRQLSVCDLHSASIYPEIDKVAGYIKGRFMERLL